MKEIPIAEDCSPQDAMSAIWGVMLFPEDIDLAFEYWVRMHLLHDGILNVPNEQTQSVPTSWLKALVNGAGRLQKHRDHSMREREGVTAGQTLWAAYLYAQTGQPLTLNGAFEVMTRGDEAKGIGGPNVKPYGNKPEIHRSWTRMSAVAHLWAALCAVDADIASGKLDKGPGALALTMGAAAGLLQWATGPVVHIAQGTCAHLIDPANAWRLPPRFRAAELSTIPTDKLPRFVVQAATLKRGR